MTEHSCVPLVSVVIPTLNSGKTLTACIESVKKQSFKNIEIIVVDSYSVDNTTKIAENYKCRLVKTRWKILGARYLGTKNSYGKYVLMLDSDQILIHRDLIARALTLFSRYDMLILAESSYMPTSWLEHLADADRKLINNITNVQDNPTNGNRLPRFFKKELLWNAFSKMNINEVHDVVVFEDAIIYYEAYALSSNVGFMPAGIWHIDEKSFSDFFRHNYQYGVTAKSFRKKCSYAKLMAKRQRFRKGVFSAGKPELVFQSCILLILKGIAYEMGYLLG